MLTYITSSFLLLSNILRDSLDQICPLDGQMVAMLWFDKIIRLMSDNCQEKKLKTFIDPCVLDVHRFSLIC